MHFLGNEKILSRWTIGRGELFGRQKSELLNAEQEIRNNAKKLRALKGKLEVHVE